LKGLAKALGIEWTEAVDVASGVSPDVEGGILPPGFGWALRKEVGYQGGEPPGETPGSTAGKMPAATMSGILFPGRNDDPIDWSPTAGPPSLCFIGPQFHDEKAACYRACDAFILPSLSEGLPLVVLEAWAHAKPVLVTDACNLPEAFAARAGLRIGPDPDGIARGLIELMSLSDAARAELGANGRALVVERFSWGEIGGQLVQVCEWVLGGGEPPECMADF